MILVSDTTICFEDISKHSPCHYIWGIYAKTNQDNRQMLKYTKQLFRMSLQSPSMLQVTSVSQLCHRFENSTLVQQHEILYGGAIQTFDLLSILKSMVTYHLTYVINKTT